MAPLSRLRLSPHYGQLASFHAEEGDPTTLQFDVPEAAFEEVSQICRHLDLELEALAMGFGKRRLIVRRSCDGPPGELDGEKDLRRGGEGDSMGYSIPILDGDSIGAESESLPPVVGFGPAEAPGARLMKAHDSKRQPRAAGEAEKLLEHAPKGLGAYYHALIDTFPGFHVPLAKLLVKRLRAVCAVSSSASGSSSSAKKKKGKKGRKHIKKKGKKKKKENKEKKIKEKKRAPEVGRLAPPPSDGSSSESDA